MGGFLVIWSLSGFAVIDAHGQRLGLLVFLHLELYSCLYCPLYFSSSFASEFVHHTTGIGLGKLTPSPIQNQHDSSRLKL